MFLFGEKSSFRPKCKIGVQFGAMSNHASNIDSLAQGWTGVSKAARENVRNGPKFAKTIIFKHK